MKLSGDETVRYIVKVGDQLRGPLTFEGVESLVYLKQINLHTPIRREDSAEFTPISQTEFATKLFPHAKVEAGASGSGNWAPPPQLTKSTFGTRKRFLFGKSKFEKVNRADKRRKVDVMDILADNRLAEKNSTYDLTTHNRFKISRKTRDFWLLFLVGNTIFLGSGYLMKSTASMVYGIGGASLFTFGLLWIMYGGVMDNY